MAGSAARSNPQRSAGGRKGRGSPAGRRNAGPTVLGRVFARPGVIMAGATFAAVMTGIVANALLFQKGHHPFPLFTPAPAAAPQAAPAVAPPAPSPVQRQVIEAPQPAVAEAPAVPQTAPVSAPPAKTKPAHAAAKPAAKPVHQPAAPHRDLIGDLLNKQVH